MTPENIIQLISLLLGGGGLIALFLITERKTKAQMENTAQALAEWQKIVEHSHQDLNGACWFGLDEGLAHFNPNGAESAFISQEQNIGDVYDYALWNNTLYLGTNKGLYRIDEDKKAHLVTGTSGIAWNIVNCKDFLAVEIDENLYVIYPDNTYDNILSGICHLTKWAYSDNLVMCSDSKGIILLEKRNGRLEIRNRLGNCDGYCQAPLKNDNLGNIWVDGLLGGVQRLTLDKRKQNVIKDKFYPI